MNSKAMRENQLFMRNAYPVHGRLDIPLVRRQEIDTSAISLIACSDTRKNDNELNQKHGVHFFVDDYRFNGIYKNPERTLEKFRQYAFLLTPDFSTYADMNIWRQVESVAWNRWVGAYWQNNGLTVIPTISWSSRRSFDFCFDGVEKNSIVAISTIGCKKSKLPFMLGYEAMLNRLNPQTIICFGDPFPEMTGNIVKVDYRSSRKVVR